MARKVLAKALWRPATLLRERRSRASFAPASHQVLTDCSESGHSSSLSLFLCRRMALEPRARASFSSVPPLIPIRVKTADPCDSFPAQRNISLCEQPVVWGRLRASVARLRFDPGYCDSEDLLQEGLAHIWRMEQEYPGHTVSWYLENASFHLRDLLKSGRSLDSPKRACQRCAFRHEMDGDDDDLKVEFICPGTIDEIIAREWIEILSQRLRPREQAVLALALEGLGTREIARRLCLSPHTVIDSRRRIASQMGKLGALNE